MKRFLIAAAAALFCMVSAVSAKTYDYRLWVYNTNLGPDSPSLELKFYNIQTERDSYSDPDNPYVPNYFSDEFTMTGDVDFYIKTGGRAIKGTGTATFSYEVVTSYVYGNYGEEFLFFTADLTSEDGEASRIGRSAKNYFPLDNPPSPFQLYNEFAMLADDDYSFDIYMFGELYQVNAYKGGPLPVPLPASGLLLLAGLLAGARPRRHQPL